jgi:hypothetical protein
MSWVELPVLNSKCKCNLYIRPLRPTLADETFIISYPCLKTLCRHINFPSDITLQPFRPCHIQVLTFDCRWCFEFPLFEHMSVITIENR